MNRQRNHLLATPLIAITTLLTTSLLALQAQAAPSTPSIPRLDVVNEIARLIYL